MQRSREAALVVVDQVQKQGLEHSEAASDERMAQMLEADMPNIQVEGMNSPEMMLLEYQRLANSEFTIGCGN